MNDMMLAEPPEAIEQSKTAGQTTEIMSGQLSALIEAVRFLTRIPLGTTMPTASALRDCPRYFPLVAAGLGAFAVGAIWLGIHVWPVWLTVGVVLAVEFRVTGGFHEDAVADFCDGFGGGWTRQQTLEIMKDSRIGTYGVLGLTATVGIRFAAIVATIERAGTEQFLVWGTAILAAAVAGRWLVVLAMVLVPPVGNRESLARDIGSRMTGKDLAIATMTALPIAIAYARLMPWKGVMVLGLLVAAVLWFRRLVLRRLGGVSGDCLGFLACLGQLIVLLVSAAEEGTWTTLP